MAYVPSKKIKKEVEDFLDSIFSGCGDIYFLDGVTIDYCSGWYIPKYNCVVVFKYSGHRRLVDDLKMVVESRVKKGDNTDYGDLWNCEWIRFNINSQMASITANKDKYDEVMALMDRLKPHIKSEMEVEFVGGGTAKFKPYDIDTKDDLIKRFWICKILNGGM